RPAIGSEQVDDECDLPLRDARCFAHSEEVLQSRFDPWGLARFIVDRRLTAAREAYGLRGDFVQEFRARALFDERDEAVRGVLKLGEAFETGAKLAEHSLDVNTGD